jgi:predicted RecA/RadA family phage recombinase
MARTYEAILYAKLTEHDQTTVANPTVAALQIEEVFKRKNPSGNNVAYVAREDIAVGASGQVAIRGEYKFKALAANTWAVGDDIYWKESGNYAITKAQAKLGDFYVGMCTHGKASGASFVRGRLNEKWGVTPISGSTSSTSVSSTSLSISSNSDSSDSSVSSVSSASSISSHSSASSISSVSKP